MFKVTLTVKPTSFDVDSLTADEARWDAMAMLCEDIAEYADCEVTVAHERKALAGIYARNARANMRQDAIDKAIESFESDIGRQATPTELAAIDAAFDAE